MKRFIILLTAFMLWGTWSKAQDYFISFQSDANYPIDYVEVTNLTQSTSVVVSGGDVLNLTATTGVKNIGQMPSIALFPNPATTQTTVEFYIPENGNVQAEVLDISGKTLASLSMQSAIGKQTLQLKNFSAGIYLLNIKAGSEVYSQKFVSSGTKKGTPEILHLSSETVAVQALKSENGVVMMQYNEGDLLVFTAYSGRFASHEIEEIIGTDVTLPFDFTLENGYYICGDAIAYSHYSQLSKMKPAYIEGAGFSAVLRNGLHEFMLPVSAGSEGFYILRVSNGNYQYLFKLSSEFITLAGESDQIHATVEKGSFAFSDSESPFTVPSNGMYNIVTDEQTGLFAIIPVEYFGIIGGALQSGWGYDVEIPRISDFNLTDMEYELSNIILTEGDFKLRYSNGWRYLISESVRLWTNFGGNLNGTLPNFSLELMPGGYSYPFPQENTGVYSVRLTWTAENGLSATLTKTADYEVPMPEKLYMIGTAVGGWEWSTDYVEMTPHSNGVYQATTELIQNKAFRFFAQMGWGTSFNYTYFIDAGGSVSPELENAEDGDKNFRVVASSGNYTITVDLNINTVTVEPATK